MAFKISSDHTTAVSTEFYWMDLDTCPKGISVWLLTKYGKPIDAIYTNQLDVVGWFPKPRIPLTMKEKLR